MYCVVYLYMGEMKNAFNYPIGKPQRKGPLMMVSRRRWQVKGKKQKSGPVTLYVDRIHVAGRGELLWARCVAHLQGPW
jgi:hypothetical protein